MKTLIIVRHGKAIPPEEMKKDEKRPLIEKGILRTEKVAAGLKRRKVKPDKLLSSHAVRAFQTAEIIKEKAGYAGIKINVHNKIYRGSPEDILNIIRKENADVDCLMIVGHNPEFSELLNLLLDRAVEDLKTSGTASLSCNVKTWKQFGLKPVKLEFLTDGR